MGTPNLLIKTHIGTLVGLKKPFTLDFTLTISIGTAELKFQKGGCLQSNSTTADRYHSGLVREQLLVRTMRIKILQSLTTTVRIEMHQPQTAMVLLIMRHSQSTSSPDEDLPAIRRFFFSSESRGKARRGKEKYA